MFWLVGSLVKPFNNNDKKVYNNWILKNAYTGCTTVFVMVNNFFFYFIILKHDFFEWLP